MYEVDRPRYRIDWFKVIAWTIMLLFCAAFWAAVAELV